MAESTSSATAPSSLEDEQEASTSSELTATLESSDGSEHQVVSLLGCLRAPTASDLARKRRVSTNPPLGTKRSKGSSSSDPKSVSPADRVKQYPDQQLTVSAGKLFCRACREELSLKKSVVSHHTTSAKHKAAIAKVIAREKSDSSIVDALRKYENSNHPKGETLPDATKVFRVKVVSTLLRAGIALNKVDDLRELLEEGGYCLSNSTNMRQLVPFILSEEVKKVKQEISGRSVSFIFDGTTHVAEAFVLILRFIGDNWELKQRVVSFRLLSKSLTGEEVARLIVESISTEMGISSQLVIAAMHDRASINLVALRTTKVLYNRVLDIGCFSHTLDRVGENMKTPVLDGFIKHWISLFSHSPKTRLAWASMTGLSFTSYSNTRWWSQYEVIKKVHDSFADVSDFLQNPDSDLPRATSQKLIDILKNPPTLRKLKMELAAVVDAMTPFVQATYRLEGDGFLALTTYQEIKTLESVISTQHYPNVNAIARLESNGSITHENQLVKYAKSCIEPAYAYFYSKFQSPASDLTKAVSAFKAARYFSPSRINELRPSTTDIDTLMMEFPFVDSVKVECLKTELPRYLSAAEDLSPDYDVVQWWKTHEPEIPNWADVCKLILLVQPSSAAAERVFSLLQNAFGRQQYRSLEDYIAVSVMLQYNSRKC